MLQPLDTVCRDLLPFLIRADPELWVNFVLRDDFTPEEVTHEQVIIHRVGDDLGDG